jgi:hypothetical protein
MSYKYLRFTLENREYPYGKITPIWSDSHRGDGFCAEDLLGKGIYPRKNMDRQLLAEMLIQAFGCLNHSWEANHGVYFASPESIPSVDWSAMISIIAVVWESCPETSHSLRQVKDGLKTLMISYITGYSALINAGLRGDSGGMKMECTYIPEELWQIFTTEGLSSKWIFEVNRTRAIVASGKDIAWAI